MFHKYPTWVFIKFCERFLSTYKPSNPLPWTCPGINGPWMKTYTSDPVNLWGWRLSPQVMMCILWGESFTPERHFGPEWHSSQVWKMICQGSIWLHSCVRAWECVDVSPVRVPFIWCFSQPLYLNIIINLMKIQWLFLVFCRDLILFNVSLSV